MPKIKPYLNSFTDPLQVTLNFCTSKLVGHLKFELKLKMAYRTHYCLKKRMCSGGTVRVSAVCKEE